MAKRKTSKKNNSAAIICCFVVMALAITGIILFMFLPFLKISGSLIGIKGSVTYSGPGCIFGGTVDTLSTAGGYTLKGSIEDVKINVVGLIAFILGCIGLFITFLAMFVKKRNDQIIVRVLSGLILVIAGIMMLSVKESFCKALEFNSTTGSLQSGPIVGGILTLASGVIGTAVPFVK